MKIFTISTCLAVALAFTSSASAAIIEGAAGDGTTSLVYDSATGAFSIDAETGGIAFIEVLSQSGIFSGEALASPAGSLATDTDTKIGFAGFSGTLIDAGATFSLGRIAPPQLELNTLLDDLTFTWNGGLGTPTVTGDLVFQGMVSANTDPVLGALATATYDRMGNAGETVSLQFLATDEDAGDTLTWSGLALDSFDPEFSNLTNTGADTGSLSDTGEFTWDPTGFARGVYTFSAMVADGAGGSASGVVGQVTVTGVPEPATFGMFALAIAGVLGLRRRS